MLNSLLAEAVAALRDGRVVAIPTDTVYGLACLEVEPLFELKERPADLAVPVLVADLEQAQRVGDFTPTAVELARDGWPGPVTIVVRRRDGGGTVGLRVPGHDVPRQLCRDVGPLPCTSANRHGEAPLTTAAAVREAFPALLVVDGGTCAGAPSAVVDATGDEPRFLRTR